MAQYASFMNMGEMNTGGYNNYFSDTSKNRILITKDDRSEFTDEDYVRIESMSNVDRIVKNDLMLDLVANVTDDPGRRDRLQSVFPQGGYQRADGFCSSQGEKVSGLCGGGYRSGYYRRPEGIF